MSNVINMEEARKRLRPEHEMVCEDGWVTEGNIMFFDELHTPEHIKLILQALFLTMDPNGGKDNT